MGIMGNMDHTDKVTEPKFIKPMQKNWLPKAKLFLVSVKNQKVNKKF